MLQHGRKSQHSAMVSGVQDVNWPPPPPDNINAKAQREWRDIISNLSAGDMPRGSFPLLSVWCSLKVELDEILFDLAQFASMPTRSEDLKRYKVLIRMRTTLTREFSQLSSKLRLTPHQRLDAHCAPRVSSGMPWDARRAANEQEEQQPRAFSQFSGDAQSRNDTPWASANGESEGAGEEEEQP